jgi:hypothetical protein
MFEKLAMPPDECFLILNRYTSYESSDAAIAREAGFDLQDLENTQKRINRKLPDMCKALGIERGGVAMDKVARALIAASGMPAGAPAHSASVEESILPPRMRVRNPACYLPRLAAGKCHAIKNSHLLGTYDVNSIRENHPDGATHAGIWTALVERARANIVPGILDDGPFFGGVTRVTPEVFLAAIDRFKALGIVEIRTYPGALAPLGGFIKEFCVKGSGQWVGCSQLLARYLAWCKANNERALQRTQFGDAMQELGYGKGRSRRGPSGKQLRSFEGLALRTPITDLLD